MYSRDILALAATLTGASAAAIQGFNYGAETDFATAFATQKALAGTNGAFTSARLYTTVVCLSLSSCGFTRLTPSF